MAAESGALLVFKPNCQELAFSGGEFVTAASPVEDVAPQAADSTDIFPATYTTDHIDEYFEMLEILLRADKAAAAAASAAASAAAAAAAAPRDPALAACAPGIFMHTFGAGAPTVFDGASAEALQAVLDRAADDGGGPLSIVLCSGTTITLAAPLRISGGVEVSIECDTRRAWRTLGNARTWSGAGDDKPCILLADKFDGPAVRVTSPNAALELNSLLFKARPSNRSRRVLHCFVCVFAF